MGIDLSYPSAFTDLEEGEGFEPSGPRGPTQVATVLLSQLAYLPWSILPCRSNSAQYPGGLVGSALRGHCQGGWIRTNGLLVPNQAR